MQFFNPMKKERKIKMTLIKLFMTMLLICNILCSDVKLKTLSITMIRNNWNSDKSIKFIFDNNISSIVTNFKINNIILKIDKKNYKAIENNYSIEVLPLNVKENNKKLAILNVEFPAEIKNDIDSLRIENKITINFNNGINHTYPINLLNYKNYTTIKLYDQIKYKNIFEALLAEDIISPERVFTLYLCVENYNGLVSLIHNLTDLYVFFSGFEINRVYELIKNQKLIAIVIDKEYNLHLCHKYKFFLR